MLIACAFGVPTLLCLWVYTLLYVRQNLFLQYLPLVLFSVILGVTVQSLGQSISRRSSGLPARSSDSQTRLLSWSVLLYINAVPGVPGLVSRALQRRPEPARGAAASGHRDHGLRAVQAPASRTDTGATHLCPQPASARQAARPYPERRATAAGRGLGTDALDRAGPDVQRLMDATGARPVRGGPAYRWNTCRAPIT